MLEGELEESKGSHKYNQEKHIQDLKINGGFALVVLLSEWHLVIQSLVKSLKMREI